MGWLGNNPFGFAAYRVPERHVAKAIPFSELTGDFQMRGFGRGLASRKRQQNQVSVTTQADGLGHSE